MDFPNMKLWIVIHCSLRPLDQDDVGTAHSITHSHTHTHTHNYNMKTRDYSMVQQSTVPRSLSSLSLELF